jgi:hypothetical protein
MEQRREGGEGSSPEVACDGRKTLRHPIIAPTGSGLILCLDSPFILSGILAARESWPAGTRIAEAAAVPHGRMGLQTRSDPDAGMARPRSTGELAE